MFCYSFNGKCIYFLIFITAAVVLSQTTPDIVHQSPTSNTDVTEKSSTVPVIISKEDALPDRPLGYHDHSMMTSLLRNVTAVCPDIVKMTSLGKTKLESDIWMMRYGHDVDDRIPPKMMFVGNIHGGEVASREVLLQLIVHLCDRYLQDAYIKQMLQNMNIYIIPSVDIDGSMLAVPGVCGSDKESNHVNDIHFMAGDEHEHSHGKNADKAAETKAVKSVLDQSASHVVISVRSGDNVIAYAGPIDKELANAYMIGRQSDNATSFGCPDQKDKIPAFPVEYSKFFTEPGNLVTYAFSYHHCAALDLRLGCCHYPPAGELAGIWEQNVGPLMSLISECNKGVFGVVVDNDSKAQLHKVRIEVDPSGYVQYTDDKGRFSFYLPPGKYIFKMSVTGYRDTQTEVTVLMGSNARSQLLQMPSSTWLLGMSPMLTVTIIGFFIFLVVIFITFALRLKKSGRGMQFDEMGFRQLPNADYGRDSDEYDSDNLETVIMDKNSIPMTRRHPRHQTTNMKEYHDDSFSDDDTESNIFDKQKLLNKR